MVSVLTSTGPFWVSSVAFCGADPGFKEATGLCSGLEAADPTICHFGRDLAACSWSLTDGGVTVVKASNQNERHCIAKVQTSFSNLTGNVISHSAMSNFAS